VTDEERQAALDNISEADLAKIQAKSGKKIKVYEEDLLEAEFLLKFGWEAYWDIYPHKDRSKGINTKEMNRLVTAARKVSLSDVYFNAQSVLFGSLSAKSNNPGSTFKKITSRLVKSAEPDHG
jgi:hypothetical protein